jgi:RHS repeat-associated protein
LDNQYYATLIISEGTSFTPIIVQEIGQNFNGEQEHYISDVNGDGRSDIIQLRRVDYNHYINVIISHGTTFETYPEQEIGVSLPIEQKHFIADVNGDGKDDIIQLLKAVFQYNISVILSHGTTFETYAAQMIGKSSLNLSLQQEHYISDVNGDGRSDIIQLRRVDDNHYINVIISHGTTFETYAEEEIGEETEDSIEHFFADFDGDGRNDILQIRTFHLIVFIKYFTLELSNRVGFDLLNLIQTPSGATTTITYEPAPKVTGAVDSSGKTYPYIANKSTRALVTNITIDDGFGTESSTSYDYTNGMMYTGYPHERINLGFEKIRITNDATGSYTEAEYYQDDPDLRGLVKKQYSFDSAGTLYTEIDSTYNKKTVQEASDDYHAVTFVYKKDEYIHDYSGETTADEYRMQYAFYDAGGALTNYDGYGNILEIKNHGNLAVSDDDVTVKTSYLVNENQWLFVPQEIRKYSNDFDENEGLAFESRFYYDNYETYGVLGDKGLVTKKEQKVKEGEWIAYRYSYNEYGAIISIKDNRAIEGGYTTQQLDYDDSFKGLVKETANALDMTETMNYDNLMRLNEIIDYDNIHWHAAHDAFGRLVKTWGPDESDTDPGHEIEYIDAVLYPEGVIQTPRCIVSRGKDTSTDGFLESRTYYDGFGRTIQVKTEGENSKWRTTDFYYNEIGRNYKTSVVYETSTSAYTERDESQPYILNEYDDLGRVIRTTNTDGTENRTIYKKRKTIYIDEKNHAVSREIYVDTEDDGISLISKTYEGIFTDEEPVLPLPYSSVTMQTMRGETRITDHQDNQILVLTDMLGRKTSYTDPDMGTWTYAYDKNSNLIAQTDARGQIIRFDYDKLNRVRYKKYDQNINTTYLYDGLNEEGQPDVEEHGFCEGMLTRIEYPGGSDSFTYDERGRIVAARKTIDSETRTVQLTYDSLDRVTTETYPDGEVVIYTYGNDGNLIGVTGDRGGTVTQYATDIAYTAQGKLEELTCGNGVRTTYDYYDTDTEEDETNDFRTHSYRLKSIHIENDIGQVIADTLYNYDAIDNIKKKTFTQDFGPGYTELFDYDAFDRLIRADGGDLYDEKTYTYLSNNNIGIKEGRTFLYDFEVDERTLPHAVSEIKDDQYNTMYTYEYDANGNMTRAQGHTTITIRAKAVNVTDEQPRMELWMEEKQAMAWIVPNTDYYEYTWHGHWDGESTIDILYQNDESGAELHIEKIIVNNEEFTPQTSTAYDRGTYWQGCFDGNDVITGQVEMNVEGALRFTAAGALPLDRYIAYDEENRITEITENGSVSTYEYDAGGSRIRKTEQYTQTYYFFSTYEEEVKDGVTTKISYYFDNGQRIAQRTVTPTEDELLYIHTDHLGSAVRFTDDEGEPVQSIVYEPFGKTIYFAGTKRTAYQFTDQEYDGGTGLYYYGARYYDQEIGRFIQADTVLDGLNRYAYCYNNPVMYVDPTGEEVVNNPPPVTIDDSGTITVDYDNGTIHTSGENGGTQNGSSMNGNDSQGFLPRDPKRGQPDIWLPDGSGYRWMGGRWWSHSDNYNPIFCAPWWSYTPKEGDYIGTTVAKTDETDNAETQTKENNVGGRVVSIPGGGGGPDQGDLDLEKIIKDSAMSGKLCTGVKDDVEDATGYDFSPFSDSSCANMFNNLRELAAKDDRVRFLGIGEPGDPTGASKRAQDRANKKKFVIGISLRHIVFILIDLSRTDEQISKLGPACGGGNTENPDDHISNVWVHFNWNPKHPAEFRSYPYYYEYNIRK